MTKYSSTVTLECHLLSNSTHSIAALLSPTRTASGQRRRTFFSVSSVMILNGKKIKCPCLRCSFWDWEKAERLDYFYNGNPRYTRITAMEYLNGHDCSLLLTATGKEPTITCTWQHTLAKMVLQNEIMCISYVYCHPHIVQTQWDLFVAASSIKHFTPTPTH